MKYNFCIVVPIYQERFNNQEKASLNQLTKIIANKEYDIVLLLPKKFDDVKQKYANIFSETKCKIHFDIQHDVFFKDTFVYSRLLTNRKWYTNYLQWKYMYIYQTDCWVTKDEFEYWTSKDYDWIGGPIITLDALWKNLKERDGIVGNGGFSLRKISTMMDILNPDGELCTTYPSLKKCFKNILIEDRFFCDDIAALYHINVPSLHDAGLFSIDQTPDYIRQEITSEDELPFGIHKVFSYLEYWKKFIPELPKLEES